MYVMEDCEHGRKTDFSNIVAPAVLLGWAVAFLLVLSIVDTINRIRILNKTMKELEALSKHVRDQVDSRED